MNSAQAPAALTRDAMLNAIAEVVLPGELSAAGRQKVVAAFVEWIASYKEGADRGYGYGASTLSAPTGASPALRYPAQFAALDTAGARRRARRRSRRCPSISDACDRSGAQHAGQGVTRLPARPTGASLIADFMGFYFNSADAWNLAYSARDRSRQLPHARRIGSRAGAARRGADMARYEADVVIIGGGITAAMVAREALELRPQLVRHRRRSRQAAVRLREPLRIPQAQSRLRREPVARRLRRRSERARRDLAHDGGRRIGAALGRRLQSLFRRRHAAEVDVRPRRRLADRVEGAREVLLRGRAAHRRLGRAEPAHRRLALRAVSDAGDDDDLQPDPAQDLGGAERHQVLDDAAGEEHGRRLRRPQHVPALQHLRDLSDRRALLAGLDVQAAARRRRRSSCTTRRSSASSCSTDATTRIAAAQARREDGGRQRRRVPRARRSCSRPATAGARICCCSRRTRASRTASRTRPITSAGT